MTICQPGKCKYIVSAMIVVYLLMTVLRALNCEITFKVKKKSKYVAAHFGVNHWVSIFIQWFMKTNQNFMGDIKTGNVLCLSEPEKDWWTWWQVDEIDAAEQVVLKHHVRRIYEDPSSEI